MAAERIILRGRAEMLKPIITEILAIHQILENRDLGEFVGHPLDEYVRAKPQSFRIAVQFYSVASPPWRAPEGQKLTRATYYVPSVSKTKIDWQTIKTACGGANGYMWGRFRATANLNDGRQMQIHGASEDEATDRLKALLALSEANLLTLTCAEEKKEGRRASDKLLYKESTRVYPAYFTIIHQEKIVTESNVATLSGNYKRSKARIPLWTETKPHDANAIIAEAIKVTGASTAA